MVLVPHPDRDVMPVPAPLLETHHLSVHYGARSALHDVTMRVLPGETLGLLGPNGAGKSTLLKSLAGMIPPSHGRVEWQGEPLRGAHAEITYVPQRAGADWDFPISVLDVTLLGLAPQRPRWRPFDRHDRDRAMEALARVEMDGLAGAQIGALSGGQQQRVFLARALMVCGRVLLLDEPFTGVDAPTQEILVDIIAGLRDRGSAIVYATHDLHQAIDISDRIALINREVIAEGPPSEVVTTDALTRAFGGSVIILDQRRPNASQLAVREVAR